MSKIEQMSDEKDSLGALMRAAQDGDGSAYRELLETVTPVIQRMIGRKRSFLQSQDVDDLVQEVLLSIHSARATYDPRRPFLPWLAAITRNRLTDSARRYFLRPATESITQHLAATFSNESTHIESTHGDHRALLRAIGQLPAGQKQAVELLKLREATLKEASRLTGMSVGALKVAVHRGIKALRTILASEEQVENRSPTTTPVRRY